MRPTGLRPATMKPGAFPPGSSGGGSTSSRVMRQSSSKTKNNVSGSKQSCSTHGNPTSYDQTKAALGCVTRLCFMDFGTRRPIVPFDGSPRQATKTEVQRATPRLLQSRQGHTLFGHCKLQPPIIHSMLPVNYRCNIGSPSPQNDRLQRMKLLSQIAINTVVSSTFVRHHHCLWNRRPTLW